MRMCFDPERIDDTARSICTASGTPGLALAICSPGRKDYVRGFGYADLQRNRLVDPATDFRIASITKAFTATALALLVQEGKLDWDDPVEKHLPYFRLEDLDNIATLTVREALSHRAGFGWLDPLWYNSPWDRSTILRRASRVLADSTRGAFVYSNVGFMLAGEALASIVSGPYEEFVAQRLLEPLGMAASGFGTRPSMAAGYELDDAGQCISIAPVDVSKANPACGLRCSAQDLAAWLRLFLSQETTGGSRLLDQGCLRQLFQPQIEVRREDDARVFSIFGCTERLYYALGWFLSDHRGLTVISHSGSLPGYRAHLAMIPEQEIGIAVLANLSQTKAPEAILYTVLDQLLGVEVEDWLAHFSRVPDQAGCDTGVESEPIQWDQNLDPRTYCGSYNNTAFGSILVGRESETLTFEWTNYRSRMRAAGADRFLLEDLTCPLLADNREVEFLRQDTGEVRGVKFVEMRFERLN